MATYSTVHAWRIPWTEELPGYSPWSCKGSDMTEKLTRHTIILIAVIVIMTFFLIQCSLLPLFQKYKQIPLTSELELTVETGDCIFKTCFPPQMVSCQQVRRNILQNLLCSRLQFYSEVFVFGEISSRTNALS